MLIEAPDVIVKKFTLNNGEIYFQLHRGYEGGTFFEPLRGAKEHPTFAGAVIEARTHNLNQIYKHRVIFGNTED